MNIPEYFIFIVRLVQWVVYAYLAITAAYLFVSAAASLFPYRRIHPTSSHFRRFAVIIPCYKEDDVILEVVKDALEHDYPSERYDIVVVADGFEKDTLEKLKKLPILLFDEKFSISTKTRAINHALRQLPDNHYNAVCILDADNLMEEGFLLKMNYALENGYMAVQGHRIAKNLNTPFAVLDAISEEINNQIFRKGQRILGFSSALIGSAMAFDYPFFKKLMADIEVVGGFDKELELRLLRDKIAIEYVPDAIVLDEKVQNVKVFTSQRRRWLSAQYHYFGIHFVPSVRKLILEKNVEYFNKAFQYLQLPRILLLGVLFLLASSSLILGIPSCFYCWFGALLLTVLALLLSTPRRFYHYETLHALFYLPLGFMFMFVSLLRIKGANKNFIHTKHTYNAFQIKRKKNSKS
jgi:cellulose synthase/poly-beta-1,6-N-acetylglucosamine synthase-like glycosyltransferase